MNAILDGLKLGTSGRTSFIGWRKMLREKDKSGGECLVNGEELVHGETTVWFNAEDCIWGCVLIFSGF